MWINSNSVVYYKRVWLQIVGVYRRIRQIHRTLRPHICERASEASGRVRPPLHYEKVQHTLFGCTFHCTNYYCRNGSFLKLHFMMWDSLGITLFTHLEGVAWLSGLTLFIEFHQFILPENVWILPSNLVWFGFWV